MPATLSNYRLGPGQRASHKTVPPPRDRLNPGGKMGWCHGGLSRTISMVPVLPFGVLNNRSGAFHYIEASWEALPRGF